MWCWKIVSGGVIYMICLCIFYHFRGRDASKEEGILVLGNFEIEITLVGKMAIFSTVSGLITYLIKGFFYSCNDELKCLSEEN